MTAAQATVDHEFDPSTPEEAPVAPTGSGNRTQISAAPFITFGYTRQCAVVVVVEGATVDLCLTEHIIMILGILLSITAIGVMCWLLFTLAIYALPFLAGITVGTWAYATGAGWPGGIVVGLLAAGLMLGVGQFLFAFVRPVWLRLTFGLAFAAPAAIAGYHAVHGIVKHAMPSETWQIIFSVAGAIAIGATAWIRIAGAEPARTGQNLARG